MIIIYEGPEQLVDLATQLGEVPGVSRIGCMNLLARMNIFPEFDNGMTVLSHKLPMWTGAASYDFPLERRSATYELSLHFISEAVLRYILCESCQRLSREESATKRTVRDYRNQRTDRSEVLYGFSGMSNEQDPDLKEVPGGYLRKTSAYVISDDDVYFPGFYHTVNQPEVDPLWDDLGVAQRFGALQAKIRDRLRYERHREPHADLRHSFAHSRLQRLAPHIVRLIDEQDHLV